MALRLKFVCWFVTVDPLTQAFMAEAMGRSRRGRRCLDSVKPLMHFGFLESDSEDIALPRPGKKSTSTRVLPKIAAWLHFSKTSQRTCLSKLLNHHFFIRLIGDVGPEASIAQPEVLDSAHAAWSMWSPEKNEFHWYDWKYMYHVYRIHIPVCTYCKFSARKIRLASLFDEVGPNSPLPAQKPFMFMCYIYLHMIYGL